MPAESAPRLLGTVGKGAITASSAISIQFITTELGEEPVLVWLFGDAAELGEEPALAWLCGARCCSPAAASHVACQERFHLLVVVMKLDSQLKSSEAIVVPVVQT